MPQRVPGILLLSAATLTVAAKPEPQAVIRALPKEAELIVAVDSFAGILAEDDDMAKKGKALGNVAVFLPRCAQHLETLHQKYSEVDFLTSEEGKGMLGVAVGSHFARHCSKELKLPSKECDRLAVSLAALVDSGRPLSLAPVVPSANAAAAPVSAVSAMPDGKSAPPAAPLAGNQSSASGSPQERSEENVILAAQHSHGGEWCLELWHKMHAARQGVPAGTPQRSVSYSPQTWLSAPVLGAGLSSLLLIRTAC